MAMCCCSGLAVLTVDSWGRRPLLLLGVSLLTVALLALSAVNTFLPASSPTATWTSVVALLLYVGAYQVRGLLAFLVCAHAPSALCGAYQVRPQPYS